MSALRMGRIALSAVLLVAPLAALAQAPPSDEQLRALKDLKRDGYASWADGGAKFELNVIGSKAILDNAKATIAMMPLDAKITPPMLLPGIPDAMRTQVETQMKASNDMFVKMLQDVFRDKFLKLGYQVVEREQIQKIMAEQNLSMTDLVSEQKKIQVGKLLAAQFLYVHEVQCMSFADFQKNELRQDIVYTGKFVDAQTGRVCATVSYLIWQKGAIQ